MELTLAASCRGHFGHVLPALALREPATAARDGSYLNRGLLIQLGRELQRRRFLSCRGGLASFGVTAKRAEPRTHRRPTLLTRDCSRRSLAPLADLARWRRRCELSRRRNPFLLPEKVLSPAAPAVLTGWPGGANCGVSGVCARRFASCQPSGLDLRCLHVRPETSTPRRKDRFYQVPFIFVLFVH